MRAGIAVLELTLRAASSSASLTRSSPDRRLRVASTRRSRPAATVWILLAVAPRDPLRGHAPRSRHDAEGLEARQVRTSPRLAGAAPQRVYVPRDVAPSTSNRFPTTRASSRRSCAASSWSATTRSGCCAPPSRQAFGPRGEAPDAAQLALHAKRVGRRSEGDRCEVGGGKRRRRRRRAHAPYARTEAASRGPPVETVVHDLPAEECRCPCRPSIEMGGARRGRARDGEGPRPRDTGVRVPRVPRPEREGDSAVASLAEELRRCEPA